MTSAAELKRLIGQRKAITVPGTANALFARVAFMQTLTDGYAPAQK